MKAHPNKDMTLKPHPKNVSFREGPDEGRRRNLRFGTIHEKSSRVLNGE